MNKQELEKMLDNDYDSLCSCTRRGFCLDFVCNNEKFKEYIFTTVLPEVLKKLLYERSYASWHSDMVDEMKSLAFKLYGIKI